MTCPSLKEDGRKRLRRAISVQPCEGCRYEQPSIAGGDIALDSQVVDLLLHV